MTWTRPGRASRANSGSVAVVEQQTMSAVASAATEVDRRLDVDAPSSSASGRPARRRGHGRGRPAPAIERTYGVDRPDLVCCLGPGPDDDQPARVRRGQQVRRDARHGTGADRGHLGGVGDQLVAALDVAPHHGPEDGGLAVRRSSG